MDSYKNVFEKTLHAKLKEKIFGRVFVKINYYDELIIKISSYGEVEYSFHIDDVSYKILNGYSADDAMREVVMGYKNYLIHRTLAKYFIPEKREVL